ncbi:N-acetylmuramic acid 6-phosphate etherase [Fulvivirga sedimenti]|uniref:N-acetylmuramic acid 6-phosphate etherase n=1 Tax=Fulvivirga sedimenti TaxID=2879465 RepID=A0A9X1HQA2_9BACT|nr:N-acetylmuramic acid 6-phosphate etherase [Fulvivirga sedimenti]MCA6074354.1 N-acetylmuramic acid 6-phosphate etherase [Fulvivirga sedimenti]
MSITESSSNYEDLEHMAVRDLLVNMNNEDKTVPLAVERSIDQIVPLVEQIVLKMQAGGRLFYIGAGTSGRLGILDASEIPPTYGMPHGKVIGIMAGGDEAIRKAVEFAEDDQQQAWKDLQALDISDADVLIGIAASGRTPYVIGGIREARSHGLVTGCIVCNPDSELASVSEYPVELIVGPEFVTGSTRMKSGTAQKLALNMISTSVMIRLGRVKGNKMVDMQLSNTKLVDRGTRMIMEALQIGVDDARDLLEKHGSVRAAVNHYLDARN